MNFAQKRRLLITHLVYLELYVLPQNSPLIRHLRILQVQAIYAWCCEKPGDVTLNFMFDVFHQIKADLNLYVKENS